MKSITSLKVISGGQTGVDRAALDAALSLGFAVGGWCPAGRRAEDGPIHPRYPLTETKDADYETRTEWNVRDSDATLVLSAGRRLVGGTQYTVDCARRLDRPIFIVDPADLSAIPGVLDWLGGCQAKVLNVAGPRDTPDRRVYASAHAFTDLLLRAVSDHAEKTRS